MRCDDGIVRPIITARILAGDGGWREIELLVDTGADRTAIRAGVLEDLSLPHVQVLDGLAGTGGTAEAAEIATQIRLECDGSQWATFRGNFAAFLHDNALDMNVLGRDILNLFAVIVDHGADQVLLIRGDDAYTIQRRQ